MISRDTVPNNNIQKVSTGNVCIPIWKLNKVKIPIKKAAKIDGNINRHTTLTFKLFFLFLFIFILYDMHKALERPPFQRQKYEELMPENEEIKEVKLHKSVFLVMAATLFGKQRKQGMTLVTEIMLLQT
jgi:hypothetical protein